MILIVFLTLLSIYLGHQFWWRRRNLPPGPVPLPFVGNLHQLTRVERLEDVFYKWTQTFGPIYTYWISNAPAIAINDFKLMQELIVKDGDTFADRPPLREFANAVRGGSFGVLESSGSLWKEHRRFALKVLRDFGLGKNVMEQRIVEELETICENVNADIRAGVVEHEFERHTDIAVGSLMNALVCGFRFTTDNREAQFCKLKKLTQQVGRNFSDPLLIFLFVSPTARKWPLLRSRFDAAIGTTKQIFDYIDEVIEEHEQRNDYSSSEFEARDFIDAFLIEQKRQEANGNQESTFTRQQLKSVCFDMWLAGQETTSHTLSWAIGYLIRHPDSQEKLHEELDRVVGSERLITMTDRTDLPYTNAVIMESQRMANLLGQNAPRLTTRDVEIGGCLIKKGRLVIPQISVLMADPKIFPEPKRFNPSRFIDESGKLKRCDELIPFSLGRRQCLGEGLARMELFLFIANLFNRYKFLSGEVPPTLRRISGGGSFGTNHSLVDWNAVEVERQTGIGSQ